MYTLRLHWEEHCLRSQLTILIYTAGRWGGGKRERETYVSARAVKLAVILNVEVDDIDGAAAVVLDDLVASVVGATAYDPRLLTGLVVLDGNGILADVLEPDELEVARAVAVNTLGLVLADDHVSQGRARAEEEDGVSVA